MKNKTRPTNADAHTVDLSVDETCYVAWLIGADLRRWTEERQCRLSEARAQEIYQALLERVPAERRARLVWKEGRTQKGR